MGTPRTLNEALERATASADVGLRFVDRHEQDTFLPWSEIGESAVRAAGAIQAVGIGPGDRVGLVLPTGPAFFDVFFGALFAGAVPVPLYPPIRLGRLEEYRARTGRMLAAVDARLVLTDRRLLGIVSDVASSATPSLGCRSLADLPAAIPSPVRVGPDDLALVQFSSGTTVDPKPAALTHAAVLTQAVLLNAFWPDEAGVRHSGVSWLPLYHDMGLIGCVMTALERPGTLTLLSPEAFAARPALWLRAISRYRATISPAPNFAYALAASRIRDEELEGADLSCWRFALNGAETVVASVLRAFERRFARWGFRAEAMTPVYGLSEAALAVTFGDTARPPLVRRFDREALFTKRRATPSSDGVEIVSVGRPLAGFSLRIDGSEGEELPAGCVGTVRVKGPTLMRGYLNRPDIDGGILPGGWLDTGDLGFLWEGELYLTGRAKDMLILRGRNHPPEEVERAAQEVEGTRPAAAVAVSYLPEGADGEVLLVLVEAARGVAREAYSTLAAACRDAILAATGLAAERVVVLEPGTLPRTSSGKLRRAEALSRFLSGAFRAPDGEDLPRNVASHRALPPCPSPRAVNGRGGT